MVLDNQPDNQTEYSIRWNTFNLIAQTPPDVISEKLTGGKIPLRACDKDIYFLFFSYAYFKTIDGQRGYYTSITNEQIAEVTGHNIKTVRLALNRLIGSKLLALVKKGKYKKYASLYRVKHFARKIKGKGTKNGF